MGNHSNTPVEIDPQALKESRKLWENFTCATKYGVIAAIVTLALMAVFLA